MINAESINYSLRNLNHRKGRSFLTVFSIMVGIMTIFIFLSFGMGLYHYTKVLSISGATDKVLITARGGTTPGLDAAFKLTNKDLRTVEQTPGVYSATGTYVKVIQLLYQNQNKYAYMISYDPSNPILLQSFNAKIAKGRLLRSGDTAKVVLGYNYMLDGKIFKKGLSLNDQIEINGTKLRVVGFMASIGNPQDDTNVYVTNKEFQSIFPSQDSYAEIVARVDINEINQVVTNIQNSLRQERNEKRGQEDFFVQSFQSLVDSYTGVLNIIIGFVILIALISVLVSGINTANTMITSVLERFREIGVLKSVGARNSDIFGIFLFESGFLGLIAGILGVGFGFLLSLLGGSILKNLGLSFLAPYFSPWLFIGCILFALLTGIISGVVPAIRASKINTVDALRYE